MVSYLGVLVPLSLPFSQLTDNMGYLSIFDASSSYAAPSYVAYVRSDEVHWLVVDLCDPFMLYYFAAGHVHRFLQEVVSGRKQAPENRLSERFFGSLPVRYRKGASLTLEKAAQLI